MATASAASPPGRVVRERVRVIEHELWILAALVVAAAVVRFATLGIQSYWYDEGVTVDLVGRPLGSMLRTIPHTESTPPLYYLVAWAWSRITGSGEFGLRALSALAGTLTVPLVYDAGRRLASRRAGLVAAALVAFNPFLIWYAQEARSYAFVVLLAAASFALFVRALQAETGGWRLPAAWAAVSALALLTHYFAAFLVGAEAVVLLVAARRRRRGLTPTAVTVGAVTAVGLALVPLVIAQAGTDRSAWIGQIPLERRMLETAEQLLIGPIQPARIAGLAATLALAAAVVWFGWVRGSGVQRRAVALCAGLALAPILLPALLDLVELDVLISRNAIVAWIPLAVAAGIALGGRSGGRAGLGVAAATCAVGLVASIAVAVTPSLQRTDWRAAAQLLAPRSAAQVIVAPGGYQAGPLDLYLRHARELHGRRVRVTRIVELGYAPHTQAACWWGAPCDMGARVARITPPLPGFLLESTGRRGPFTASTFRAAHHHAVTRALLGGPRHGPGAVGVFVQGGNAR